MRKSEAKKWLYQYVIDSIKKKKPYITTGMLSPRATQKDVVRVQEAMDELVVLLEKKLEGRQRSKADAGGEGEPSETEVPTVREPEAGRSEGSST